MHAGRAGVPMEVMGLMLGEFVDDYTVRVVDVFAMPQSGTGVSVEAVDPVFQTKMLDMLKQVGRCAAASVCCALCWVLGALFRAAMHWVWRVCGQSERGVLANARYGGPARMPRRSAAKRHAAVGRPRPRVGAFLHTDAAVAGCGRLTAQAHCKRRVRPTP